MKSLSRSNATADTHPPVPHNCPSCRCRSTDFLKLKHSESQPLLAQRPQEPNLYLSNHLSEPASEQPSRPFLSGIFQRPSQRITFNYTAASSKQTNISFSYTSPPKSRKPRSLDCKFNTRKFKNMHFPLISQQDDDVPVRKVARGKEEPTTSPYYQVYTAEKTPQKHRILKKEKSKQRLEVTLSKRSSSNSLQQPQQINQYQLGPKNTPINALWMEHTQKSIKQQEINRMLNREFLPASIDHIQEHASRQQIRITNLSLTSSQKQVPLLPLHCLPSNQAKNHRKYPTIQSLHTYETKGCMQGDCRRVSQGQTSLRFAHQTEGELSESELARSISEELSLHYDYYYPQDESDRSLSLHLAL